ncbi:Hypothetical protein POVN_LOCUS50 [uncultured virus]|nr:Hypothetical protein POVN_LOCUS50 [uncultured virus]
MTTPAEPRVGPIVTQAPTTVALPKGYSVERDTQITSLDEAFFKHNILLRKGEALNKAVLDPTLSSLTGGYIFRLVQRVDKGDEHKAFILAVPHTLSIDAGDALPLPSEDKEEGVPTVLATHLAVAEPTLSGALVGAVMDHGFKDHILTGYYYLPTPGVFGLPLNTWYRPLNLMLASKAGYAILVPRIKDVADDKVAVELYKTSIKHRIRPTKLDDFDKLQHRHVMVRKPSETEWKRLNAAPLRWLTILVDKQVAVVGAYRPLLISNEKEKKLVKAAQLVYLEVALEIEKKDVALAPIESFIGVIASEGYVVLHGASQGPFATRGTQLKCCGSGLVYLNFYNLQVGAKLDASSVSLLYL